MKKLDGAVALIASTASLACTSALPHTAGDPPPIRPPAEAPKPAEFGSVLAQFAAHERAGSWTSASCSRVARAFEDIAERHRAATGKLHGAALYNAGVAHQRCGELDQAATLFEASGKVRAFHRARAQAALYRHRKTKDLDATIEELGRIIQTAKFQNVEALVSLAALQLERRNDLRDADGTSDFDRAKKNLQRALAIDDSYMPALNQLAVYYLELAKAEAGGGRTSQALVASGTARHRPAEQRLELAALVASQAIRKDPRYAPIHNTAGLVQVALGDFNSAVRSFRRARELDPSFFEAHMNYAATNLSFRGFSEAEKAYRSALTLRPDEYEAHLGLALALRGQLGPSPTPRQTSAVRRHLARAKRVAPDRPEAYYNEGILIEEFEAKASASPKETYEKAIRAYATFIRKAGRAEEYSVAVARAKERTSDIRQILDFLEKGKAASSGGEPVPTSGGGTS